MDTTACINEIFSSLQGEGLYAGEKMTFIRFANCTLGCKWCDTETGPSKKCVVYSCEDGAKQEIPNPINIVQLNNIIEEYTDKIVAITGGEPLEQIEFLKQYLPTLHRKRKVLLETNGIYPEALKAVANFVDVVSMDVKLPSSTGTRAFWEEHKQFLTTALEAEQEIYIKLVVTKSTSDKDVSEAIKLISKTNRYIQVFIQPVTPNENFPESISNEKLLSFKRLFGAWLPNVSISQQMHKEWGVK